MKKITYALMVVGLGLSPALFAAPIAVPSGGAVTGGTTGDCPLLSENVKLNLSASVVGAFNCNVATNTITVGTCHNAGSRNASITCAQIGSNEDGSPIFNNDECDADAVADSTVITGSPDFRGFFAQTSGGSVAPSFLNGNCSAGILTAHEKIQ
jgi:hypothetical protein